MNAVAMLGELADLARAFAEYYSWLSELFADDDEAQGLFFHMSIQEQAHCNLLEYQRRMMRSGSARTELAITAHVRLAVDELREFLQSMRVRVQPLSLEEALDSAMRVEASAAEQLQGRALALAEGESGRLLKSLARDDREHYFALKQFAERRLQSAVA